MSFFANAERNLPVTPEVAFDQLADHASWDTWMPRTFRPDGGSSGTLRVGDKLRVFIDGAPLAASIVVRIARRPAEIMWTGGVKGLLWAEHHFHFEAHADGGTLVRSVERWTGALAPLVRRLVQPAAERIGNEQLTGLARAVSA